MLGTFDSLINVYRTVSSLYHQLYLFGAGVLLLLLFDDAGFDSQHTVPLLQELVLCKMLEGLEQSEDMD